MSSDDKTISKYLSKILRHTPEAVGLELEPGGWVDALELLAACKRHGKTITYEQLKRVVEESDKQRFAIEGRKIRANQGHSVEVDLQLQAQTPPDTLYHGTGVGSVDAIYRDGLLRMSRHHVHMSADIETAVKVGSRHGKPAVFIVAAARLVSDGTPFYKSANGVWLAEHVPTAYLTRTYP